MVKKIIIIIAILLVLGCGIYLAISQFGGYRLKADLSSIETLEIKMPFESGLSVLELNNFDIGLELPVDLFSNIFTETDLINGEAVEFKTGEIPAGEAAIESGTPPADWEPDEATCNQFKTAPSCSFVPSEYRDLCEKCREE